MEPRLLRGSVVCVRMATSPEPPWNAEHLYWSPVVGAEDAQHVSSEHLADLDPRGAEILERNCLNCLSPCSGLATSWHAGCGRGFAPAVRSGSCRAVGLLAPLHLCSCDASPRAGSPAGSLWPQGSGHWMGGEERGLLWGGWAVVCTRCETALHDLGWI